MPNVAILVDVAAVPPLIARDCVCLLARYLVSLSSACMAHALSPLDQLALFS